MTKNQIGFSRESEWFYRQYADENAIDYLQLIVLDLLSQADGRMTLSTLYQALPYSRLTVRNVLSVLEEQSLIQLTPDLVSLTELAPFMIDDVLSDFHAKMEETIPSEPEVYLSA